ncbi:MAG: ATP-binding protein [Pedobacter sp.]|uniref:ATP-binding protein n=1 Tax=Pedobacter sp. TaxID=1411316 RepID=UPI0033910D5A
MENIRTELKAAEERYKILFENIPGATAIYNGPEMEIVMANAAMIGFWGKDPSVIGKPLMEAVPELEGQPFIGLLQNVYHTGETCSAKSAAAVLEVDGRLQTFYFDFTYRALKDMHGNIEGIIHSATNVTELVLAKQKIAASEERLNFSLQSAGIGTWNFDMENNSFVLDTFGRELFGLDDELGLTFENTLKNVHPDDVRDVYNAFINTFHSESEGNCDCRFRVILPGTELRWLHFTGKALYKDLHTIEKFAGIVTDITKETAGIEAQRKLQYQKDNFLSIASHELKTPVTSIKAYAQLLERMLKKEGDLQKADMMTRLTGQVKRLTILLEDLLDVSKISNDRLDFKRDYHSFNEIVTDNIRDLDFQENGHAIETDLTFMGNIFCDKMRISQVMNNLISNAIKYSPDRDRILITTAQRMTDVVFCVRDFGIGISKENIGRVFDQFYRVSTAESYSYQGMGLGLFISAEIIRQEGGKIWVDSEEHSGSTFCFSLPLNNNIR